MSVPDPTPIYRFIHMDNLDVCLKRGGLHAPNHTPEDGLTFKTIHNVDIQLHRRITPIPCGPGGVIHDYVAFYFGYRSPMMFQLKTGWVEGYNEGQEPLVYLITTAQAVQQSGAEFVFSDGHGIASFTEWFGRLDDLNKVDWNMVYERIWKDYPDDMDRQRRKQAEFLVYHVCDWSLIEEIAVVNDRTKKKVESILSRFPSEQNRPVRIRRAWYY